MNLLVIDITHTNTEKAWFDDCLYNDSADEASEGVVAAVHNDEGGHSSDEDNDDNDNDGGDNDATQSKTNESG